MKSVGRNVIRIKIDNETFTQARRPNELVQVGGDHNHIVIKKVLSLLTVTLLILAMVIGGALSAFADSKSMAEDTFTDTITHPGDIRTINKAANTWTTTPNSSTDNPSGVHQSQDNQTPYLTFGSAMPLSTIYIDTSVFWNDSSKPENAVFAWEKSSPEIGFGKEISTNTTQCNGKDRPYFDPTVSGARKLLGEAAGAQGNYFSGPLYSYTFPGAATLPDGSSANVKITYSNMHLYVDTAAPNVDTNGYQNKIYLPLYNDISFEAQNQSGAGRRTAGIIDARIQVVDDNGKPIDGTFIYAMCGLNVYRSENAAYHGIAYAEDNNWFSEGIRVNSGTASDIYVRSANATESGDVNPGYWPKVSNETAGVYEGAVRFDAVARAVGGAATNVRGENNTYQTGFVTTANASTGISLTGQNTNVNTWLSKGAIMWHRIRSVTGPGGNIQTTTEGNKGGTLDDKADNGDDATVLGQGTYVVPDGKTVIYTMTPNRGYVLKELRISDSLTSVSAPISGVDTMNPGDTMTVPVATGKNVTITKLPDGSYTAEFPENNADHTIMVTWIPDTTENVSVDATKKWYDKNNRFGVRGGEVVVHVNGQAQYASNEVHEYPQDFLPAQKVAAGTAADGNEAWTIKWGDGETNNHGYTGAVKGETVYDKLSSLPQQIGGSTAYYFYDYNTRQFRGYTYNTTTGKFEATDNYYWVNFLPKYDETGNTITYTVEEDVPNGYSVTTVVNNSGAASTTMADFDYTLVNVLEPVGTVKVKATKALKGRPFNGTDEFTFVLAGLDGAPMPVNTAVLIPAQGEDVPKEVAKTITPAANTVLAEADFGVISYRKSDLTPTKVTYGTPIAAQTSAGYVKANDEQKAAIRFWTVNNIPRIVDKIDKNGNLIYERNGKEYRYNPNTKKLYNDAGDEITNFDLNDYTRAKATLYSNRTFDMLTPTDVTEFGQLDTGLRDAATATAYEGVFKYTVTENPKRPDYVENDTETHNMTVRVFYNEKENKLYIDDEEATTASKGVTDITAETTTALTTPSYTLHRDFFTNAYDNEVSWDPEITKILNGRPIKADQFKDYFTIKAVDTTENINAQVQDKVADTETPMPGDANATTGIYPHGGTAKSKTQEIKSATSAPQGTNEVKGIVGFDTITYTNDDLLKEINYDSATAEQKNRVFKWVNGSNVYGPIPGSATATVTKADGTTGTVTYDDATDAQRKEVKTRGDGWYGTDGTYFDITQATPTDLAGSKGYYYLDSRKFTYKIWESGTAKAGYTNDTHNSESSAYEVEVTVTRDNSTGKLSVAQNKTTEELKFENKYAASTDVELKGSKVLDGRELKAEEFSFTISAVTAGAPMPSAATVKNAADGTINFGNITFTHNDLKANKNADPGAYDAVRTEDGFYEKTFVYEIKETAPTADGGGITRDTSTKTIAITVREDDKGNFKVVAVNGTTAGDADKGISFTDTSVNFGTFTNEYEASGSDTVDATKTLNGGKLNAGDFHFQLLDNKGTVLATVSNDAAGKISFPVAYNLSQVKADQANSICTYDSTAKTWNYTYTMKELKTDNRGTDNITYDPTGTGTGHTLTVIVKDNENGTLSITPSTDSTPIAFINTVSTRDLTLTKIWIDNDADEISKVTRPDSVVLTVTANVADATVLSSATGTGTTQGWTIDTAGGKSTKNFTLTKSDDASDENDAVWRKTIEDLPRYKADGTAITYTVDELDANVPTNYKKSVISAANTVVNTYTLTSISGTKIWVDGGKAHAISADLDGKLTVKWTDANGGSGTVTKPHIDYDNATSEYNVIGLPKYSDNGALRTYYVEETQLDGYKAPVYDNSASTDTTLTEAQKADTSKAYNGGKITNTITGTVDVTGTKVWKNGTASPTAPNAAPTLTVTRISSKSGAAEETVTTDADGNTLSATWNTEKTKYEFKELPKYDSEGYEYTYKVTETTVSGYLPPQYSDGTYAANGGTITNIKETESNLDIPVTKVMTGSTRISDWNFEISLYTGQNGTGDKVSDSKNVLPGTLASDGLSETSTVTFENIAFRMYNDNGTVKAQMRTKDNPTGDDEWVDLTNNGDGTYSTKLYAHETSITTNNTGLTQPSSDTEINIIVTNNNDGTISVHMTDDVTAGNVITDNNDGTVLAEASQEGYKVANKHEQSVEAEIDIKKTLEGIDLQADDSFTFTATYVPDTELSADEQARLAAGLTDTSFSIGMSDMSRGASTADTNHPYGSGNSATGKIKIPFTKTGTYKFNVTESGSEPGVTNDAKAETGEVVTVKVEKDTDGKLKYSVTYADGSEADFTNIYKAEGDAQIHARKIVNGVDWDEGMSFWFKLVPKTAPDGYTIATMPKPAKELEGAHKDNGKTAGWDLAGFTQDSIGKEFVYSVTEQTPNFNGYDPDEWALDTSEHTVTIVPYDKGNGTLGFRHYHDGSTTESGQSINITNRKKGTSLTLFASKKVVNKDGEPYWPSSLDSFEIKLTALDGAPMPGSDTTVTMTASDAEELNFGTISFDDAYSALNEGGEKTFTYEYTEVVDSAKDYIEWGIDNTSKFTITVKIAKDASGNNIDPVVTRKNAAGEDVTSAGYPVIKNKYLPEGKTDLELTKILNGDNLAANEFSFTLYDANKQVAKDKNNTEIKNKKNDANGKVALGTLKFDASMLDANGHATLTYNIREDIPVGAVAQDDETLVYAADTTLEVRDAHVWVKDGITYDPAISHPVTIALQDNGNGTITATPNTATSANKLNVTNIYEAEGSQTFSVYKYLEERPIRRAGFEFELKGLNGAPMPTGVTGDTTTTKVLPDPVYKLDGTASFADIVYTMDDLKKQDGSYETSKTFEYLIKEIPASTQGRDGLTYADTVYKAAVTVSGADSDGVLDVSVAYSKDSGSDSKYGDNEGSAQDTTPGANGTLDFTNIYDSNGSATVNLVKTILGRAWQEADAFKLKIEPLDDASYVGGGDHKTVITDESTIPLPGNTIDPDHRELPGNASTGGTVVVKGTDSALGGDSRIKTTDEIKFTDDMLTYDSADGYLKGVFIYKVTEDTTSLPAGFTQTQGSTTTYYARIDVLDDRMGKLETTVSYYDNENNAKNASNPIGTAPLFSNTYDATGEAEIPVKKFFDQGNSKDDAGWSLLNDGEKFSFTAAPVGEGPAVTPTTLTIDKNTQDHKGVFKVAPINLSMLTYTTSDKNKDASGNEIKYADGSDVLKGVKYMTFIGHITENDLPASIKGVDKDSTDVYVKLTSIDNLDGTIDTQWKFYKNAACTQELTFGRTIDTKDAEFVNIYRDVMDVQVTKTWHDANDTAAIAARPEIKIQLTRQTQSGNIEMVTSLDGNAKLYAEDGTTEISYANGEATVTAEQLPVTFKNLPATDRSGNAYTYNIEETDAGTGYYESKDPEVVQEGDNPTTTDVVEPRIIELTNSLSTKVTVKKIWQDGNDPSNRGTVIVAGLYKNGTLLPGNIKMVQSDSDPAWQTTFDNLPMYDENDITITYTAKEMAVPAEYYTSLVEYSLDGTSWTDDLSTLTNWNTDEDKYVQITNILLRDLEVEKEWAGIPVSNVEFELYRTTREPAIAAAAERTTIYVDANGNQVPEGTDGATAKILNKWTPPTDAQGQLTDGWEKVTTTDIHGTTSPVTHTFPTDAFNQTIGGSAKYKFEDLEKYDKNGNVYYYRVYEKTYNKFFETTQDSDTKITNKNSYAGMGIVKPNVVKELDGRNWNNDDTFYFKIEPVKLLEGGDGKWENVTVTEFSESYEDAAAKALVPLPDDGDPSTANDSIATVTANDAKVGAIGRSVDFANITFVSGSGANGTTTHTGEGTTTNYYYKIYEVDETGAAVADTTKDGITYDKATHYLRVEVIDNGDGTITTNRYWDGSTSSTAVPVFTNTYKAVGRSLGFVIKRIAGREFKDDDEFTFQVTNLAGAPLRFGSASDTAITIPTPTNLDPLGYDIDAGAYVSGNAGKYQATGLDHGQDVAQKVGVNWITSEDLTTGADGIARGTFLYSFRELGGDPADTITKVADLDYDANVIYLRLDATDDQKGNITFEYKYYLDAACTRPLEGREHAEPTLLVITDSDDEDVLAVGDIAPAGAQVGTHTVTAEEAENLDSIYYGMNKDDEVTFTYLPAGYWRNTLVKDIPVTKQWVMEDKNGNLVPTEATDDVTVELYRYAVYKDNQGIWRDADRTQPVTLPTTYGEDGDSWEFVHSDTFKRGDFTAANDYQYTITFNNVDVFEQNENGVPTTREYIFRVREITNSEAYETTYAVTTASEDPSSGQILYTPDEFAKLDENTANKNTLVDQDGLGVQNKISATNVANIAVVKQLIGRDWMDVASDGITKIDRYHFTLTPIGQGTYDANSELVRSGGKVVMDQSVTNIPMPETKISAEADDPTANAADAVAAKITDFVDTSKVDAAEPVGEGERLARFGPITYTMDDLSYDDKDGHMQGDFFYKMQERIPPSAVLLDSSGNKTSTTYDQATATQKDGGKFFDAATGITYDSTIHYVHVKVRENRTDTLTVQVAYDETTEGDISTGTQFTPVITNSYGTTTTVSVGIDKYVMGRAWKADDKFDFTMTPVGGAPFVHADENQFGELADGKAKCDGTKHTMQLTVPDNKVGTRDVLSLTFPGLSYTAADLNKTTTVGGELKYTNGRDVPANTPYAQYMYVFEETKAYPEDLDVDPDTEYAQITLIDQGDGMLDVQVKIFVDRFAQNLRKVPAANGGASADDATHPTFVNQALRDIKVTKIWKGEPTSDATVILEYRPKNGNYADEADGWTQYDSHTFKTTESATRAGTPATDTINDLTLAVNVYEYTFKHIPVYANDGDEYDLTDAQLEWRIVENAISGVETYYGVDDSVLYANREQADGYSLNYDKASDIDLTNGDKTVDDLDKELYVTNVHAPDTNPVVRKLSVVKELAGRDWTGTDEFTFTLDPVGIGTYDPTDGSLYTEGSTTKIDRTKLKRDASDSVITDIPLPRGDANGNAIAKDDVADEYKLTDSQRQANFGDIIYSIDNLTLVSVPKTDSTGKKIYLDGEGNEVALADDADTTGYTLVTEEVYRGDFVYDMYEVIPDAAIGTPKSGGLTATTYGEAKLSADFDPTMYTWTYNNIVYSTDKHDVHVHVERQDTNLVTTISYDGKPYGGAVPVFVNKYVPPVVVEDPIEITATKTWAGENEVYDEETDTYITDTSLRDDVVLHLYGLNSDGLVVFDAGTKKIALDDESSTVTWTNLPKHHYSDDELEWKIVEDPIFGYTSSVTGDAESGFEVTNTYVGPVSEITVTKEWQDDNDRDGKRPESVEYTLWKKVGTSDPVEVETVTAVEKPNAESKREFPGQEDDFGYTWRNLAVTEEVTDEKAEPVTTERVEYQDIQEQATNDDGDLLYVNKDDDSDVITKAVLETLSDDDQANYEPQMITVSTPHPVEETEYPTEVQAVLYYVTEVYEDTVLSEIDTATNKRKYTEPVVEAVGPGEFNVINARTDYETVNVIITKTWSDSNNADGLRPSHIKVILLADGTPMLTEIITSESASSPDEFGYVNTWEYEFENLPKRNSDGKLITYSVDEVNVAGGYTSSVSDIDSENRIIIVNSRNYNMKSIAVTKVWQDGDGNTLSEAPEDATFHLMKIVNGEVSAMEGDEYTVTIPKGAKEDELKVVWGDLDILDENGNPIEYNVTEDAVDGYSTSYGIATTQNNATTLTVTNKAHKETIIEVPIEVPVIESPKPVVTYIDPLADGSAMNLYSEYFTSTEAAKAEADPGVGKDSERKHAPDMTDAHSGEGYTFTGWSATQDKAGNWIVVAKYNVDKQDTPVPTQTVTYIDGVTGKIIQSDAYTGTPITAPEPPTHSDYTWSRWVENEDDAGNKIYTAVYNPECRNTPVPPTPSVPTHWVTYVDPDGTVYVAKTTISAGQAEPAVPADPTKDGYTFGGWVRTTDAEGNVTYTAKWLENAKPDDPTPTDPEKPDDPTPVNPDPEKPDDPTPPAPETHWVQYVDENGNIIYMPKVVVNGDEDEPTPPADPTKDGYVFDGWNRQVDDNGNVTYTATWKPESKTDPTPAKPEKPAENVPKTGDANDMLLWPVLIAGSTAAAVLARRRQNSK